MANPDAGIKKVIILKSSLPAYNGTEQAYFVRYRIVSEDKNRTSHWSVQNKIPVLPQIDKTKNPPEEDIPNSIEFSGSGKYVNVVWTPPASNTSEFYVYLKWNNEPYKYMASVSTTTYSVVKPEYATSVQVAVQVPAFPKERFSSATLFETEIVSLVV